LDGYVRVSQVGGRAGETFISPEVQREEIKRWATRHGAVIAHVFQEMDVSGARRDRPMLQAALERVERGESRGIVVAYLSRFGRSLIDGVTAIQRITDAGGTFVSVREGLDLSTDIGRLMLGVLLSVAEWELDRTRENWLVARERAVARGVCTFEGPYGYRRKPDGRWEPHRVTGPVVTELFRRRAAGASISDLTRWLASEGHTTRGGKRWYPGDLSRLLGRRLYRGELRHGDYVNLTAFEALTDEVTWARAQGEYRAPTRAGKTLPLLSGIVRCAGCQRLMHIVAHHPGASYEHRLYYCGRAQLTGPCQARAKVLEENADSYVEAIFWQELGAARRMSAELRLERLQEDVRRREQEFAHYRDNPSLPGRIGPDRFAEGLAVRARRLDRARAAASRALVTADTPKLPAAAELRARWPTMNLDERRAAIAQVVDCVFVDRNTRLPPHRRFHVCLHGDGPAGLRPYACRKRATVRPFDPSTVRPSARLRRREPDLSENQLRSAFAPLLDQMDRWPNFRELQAAGLAHLHLHLNRHGGAQRVAERFGVPFTEGTRDLAGRWSEERIRAELKDYLADRNEWPPYKQFTADGKNALRKAVNWFGGPERWAPELGVHLRPNRRTHRRWSYIQMREEVARLTRSQTNWPSEADFENAGLSGMHRVMRNRGIREQLMTELGLSPPDRSTYRPTRWTDDAITQALDGFLAGYATWPTKWEFDRAGLGGLGWTFDRRGEKFMRKWAERYGFEPQSWSRHSK
jgi:DNA invertase Pin-like site-specific DNA recombinase